MGANKGIGFETARQRLDVTDDASVRAVAARIESATGALDALGTQPPSEGAKVVVRAATLGNDGPTGAFLDANGAVSW